MHPRVSGFPDGRPSTLPPPIRTVGWYPIIVHAQEFLSKLTKLKALAEAWGVKTVGSYVTVRKIGEVNLTGHKSILRDKRYYGVG